MVKPTQKEKTRQQRRGCFEVTTGDLLCLFRLAPCDLGDPGWGIPSFRMCTKKRRSRTRPWYPGKAAQKTTDISLEDKERRHSQLQSAMRTWPGNLTQ